VRDIGLIDVETRPYKLVMMATNLGAPEVKTQQETLRKELADSNITLITKAIDGKSVAPDGKPIRDIDTLTKPLFWLIAPDERPRVTSFDPSVSLKGLVGSALREQIFIESRRSLCTVILIESDDGAANQAARAKVEKVLEQVNRARSHFENAPDSEVRLLSLPIKDRPKERWTLWGLGEELAAPKGPKVAVIFGKMRRAGELFEGDWKEAALFARIAILAQSWDSDARAVLGPSLPYVWSNWGGDEAVEVIGWNPTDPKKVEEAKKLLAQPPVKDPMPRKLAYEDFVPKNLDPHHFPPVDNHNPPPVEPPEPPVRRMPTMASSTELGLALMVLGVIGWIALGIAAWMLEKKLTPPKTQDSRSS
jgi:hypothetical protein